MSQQPLTVIEDDESMIGNMMQAPASIGTAIQMMAAMADKRIATARMYPRKISKFKSDASQLLREDIETARSAEYAKPIGGGTVKGPSVRLAELAAMCWGNLEVKLSEPVVGDKSVVVTASAWDIEKNYLQDGMATTSILDKHGNRYKASMIETACMATAAKARRNAILNVIPRSYINDLLEVAKEVAAGNKKPLEQVRRETLDFFARTHKVQADQIFEMLGITGIDDINEGHLDELRPIATALKEGSATVDEFFTTKTESKADAVKAKIAERKASQTNGNGGKKPADGKLFPTDADHEAALAKDEQMRAAKATA